MKPLLSARRAGAPVVGLKGASQHQSCRRSFCVAVGVAAARLARLLRSIRLIQIALTNLWCTAIAPNDNWRRSFIWLVDDRQVLGG